MKRHQPQRRPQRTAPRPQICIDFDEWANGSSLLGCLGFDAGLRRHMGENLAKGLLWINPTSNGPQNELGDVHAADGGLSLENPRLSPTDPLRQIPLSEPSSLPHLPQQIGQTNVFTLVLGFGHA